MGAGEHQRWPFLGAHEGGEEEREEGGERQVV